MRSTTLDCFEVLIIELQRLKESLEKLKRAYPANQGISVLWNGKTEPVNKFIQAGLSILADYCHKQALQLHQVKPLRVGEKEKTECNIVIKDIGEQLESLFNDVESQLAENSDILQMTRENLMRNKVAVLLNKFFYNIHIPKKIPTIELQLELATHSIDYK